MFEAIREWLNSDRNYGAGVILALRYSTDPKIINCFKEQIQTDFKRKKLVEVLTELYKDQPKQQAVVKPQADIIQAKAWPADNKNEVLASLREQWRPLYGEMSNLQARIHDVALAGNHDPSKEMEAYQMAESIMRLNGQINEIYAKKEYFLKHGKLPDPVVTVKADVSPDQAFMRKKTVERYLRDLANKLKRSELSDLKRNKWIPKWDNLCEEIRQLNQKLNRPSDEGIPQR